MSTQLYCTVTYDDGRVVNAKFIGDGQGVRAYIQDHGIKRIEAWPGATIARRQSRNEDTIVLTGVEEPVPFTLVNWPGCHCGSSLKAFRAPSKWEDQ